MANKKSGVTFCEESGNMRHIVDFLGEMEGNESFESIGKQVFEERGKAELDKCRDSEFGLLYFMSKYYKIVEQQEFPKGTFNEIEKDFKLRPHICRLLLKYCKTERCAVILNNEIGKTSTAIGFLIWKAMFTDNFIARMVVPTADESEKIVQRIRLSYRHVPEIVRQGGIDLRIGQNGVQFPNGSKIIVYHAEEFAKEDMDLDNSMLYVEDMDKFNNNDAVRISEIIDEYASVSFAANGFSCIVISDMQGDSLDQFHSVTITGNFETENIDVNDGKMREMESMLNYVNNYLKVYENGINLGDVEVSYLINQGVNISAIDKNSGVELEPLPQSLLDEYGFNITDDSADAINVDMDRPLNSYEYGVYRIIRKVDELERMIENGRDISNKRQLHHAIGFKSILDSILENYIGYPNSDWHENCRERVRDEMQQVKESIYSYGLAGCEKSFSDYDRLTGELTALKFAEKNLIDWQDTVSYKDHIAEFNNWNDEKKHEWLLEKCGCIMATRLLMD